MKTQYHFLFFCKISSLYKIIILVLFIFTYYTLFFNYREEKLKFGKNLIKFFILNLKILLINEINKKTNKEFYF